MYPYILILCFSLVAALSMVLFRLSELKSGKISLPRRRGFRTTREIIILKKEIAEEGKRLSIYGVVMLLRGVARGFDYAKGFLRLRIRKMEDALTHKGNASPEQGAVSLFLKDIAEHKKHLRLRK